MGAAPARLPVSPPAAPPAPRRARPDLTVVPGAAPAPVRRPQPAPARRQRADRRRPLRVAAAVLLVTSVVFGLVLLNIYLAQVSFELSDLQKQATQLETEQRRLRLEVARAEAPENIEAMAEALGLVAPGAPEEIRAPAPPRDGAGSGFDLDAGGRTP